MTRESRKPPRMGRRITLRLPDELVARISRTDRGHGALSRAVRGLLELGLSTVEADKARGR